MGRNVATDPVLETIVQRLLARMEPELILLYGSRAWGTPREDSDYDLMIVLRDAAQVEQSRRAAIEALRGLHAEPIVISAEDYARQQHDPGHFSYPISRAGRVLYSSGRVPQHSERAAHVREDAPTEGLALWIRRAENDFRVMESALTASEPIADAICFHAHACVEKLFKAMIVQAGTFPPRTRKLKELLAMQPESIRSAASVADACALLSNLFPRSRYPELPEPTPDEARRAAASAREIRQLVRSAVSPR